MYDDSAKQFYYRANPSPLLASTRSNPATHNDKWANIKTTSHTWVYLPHYPGNRHAGSYRYAMHKAEVCTVHVVLIGTPNSL